MYQLFHGLREDLKTRGFPIGVLYEPERLDRGNNHTLVVVKRSKNGGGETIGEVQGSGGRQGTLGDRRASWWTAGEIKVYASSPKPGAASADHEELSDWITQGVVVAALDWVRNNNLTIQWLDAGFLSEAELSEEEQPAGAVFVLKLRVGRGIFRQGWDYFMPLTGEIKDTDNIEGPPPS